MVTLSPQCKYLKWLDNIVLALHGGHIAHVEIMLYDVVSS